MGETPEPCVEIIDDDPPTIVCRGMMGSASVDALVDALVQLCDGRPPRVLLDFRPVTALSFDALRELAAGIERCDSCGVVVEIDPCPFLERLFETSPALAVLRERSI